MRRIGERYRRSGELTDRATSRAVATACTDDGASASVTTALREMQREAGLEHFQWNTEFSYA